MVLASLDFSSMVFFGGKSQLLLIDHNFLTKDIKINLISIYSLDHVVI